MSLDFPFSQYRVRSALLAAACLAATLPAAAADDAKPVPQAAVEALNKLSGGPHVGYRANHAKGVLVTGSFTAAPGADSLSKAPHFASGKTVRSEERRVGKEC